MKNSQSIALKQAVAFSIDLSIVSLPLIISPTLEIFPLFVLLWFCYIPLSEYYFTQTFGMKLVGTHIYISLETKEHISFTTAVRRQIARIGFLWGVVGWFLMFFGKPYNSDYVISDGKYSSIKSDEDGLVEVHKNNQYKVMFFALVVMAFIALLNIIKMT